METPASQRIVGEQAVPLPKIMSEDHRLRSVATRNAVAAVLASAEEMMNLLEPKAALYEGDDFLVVRREHQRRMEALANLRMELEHETDLIERGDR